MRYATKNAVAGGIGDAIAAALTADLAQKQGYEGQLDRLADRDYKMSRADEARSAIPRNMAETEKLNQAMRLVKDPAFLQQVAGYQANMPVSAVDDYQQWINTGAGEAPENSGQLGQIMAGLMLAGSGSNPTAAPKTSMETMELNARQKALQNYDNPTIAARINAALEGEMPYSNVGNTGAVLDKTSGNVSINPQVAGQIADFQARSGSSSDKSFMSKTMPRDLQVLLGTQKVDPDTGQPMRDFMNQPIFEVSPEFLFFAELAESMGAKSWYEVANMWNQQKGRVVDPTGNSRPMPQIPSNPVPANRPSLDSILGGK